MLSKERRSRVICPNLFRVVILCAPIVIYRTPRTARSGRSPIYRSPTTGREQKSLVVQRGYSAWAVDSRAAAGKVATCFMRSLSMMVILVLSLSPLPSGCLVRG